MDLSLLSKGNRDEFIEENKGFIYATTQGICKRRLVWENDEELSIALIAFDHACETFDSTKGNFHSYATVIIRNALIDFFRKSKFIPMLLFVDEEEKINYIDEKNSLNEFERTKDNRSRAEEILQFSEELKKYKLDFSNLVESSPSHTDTRNSLLNLAFLCVREKLIVEYINEKKLLPIKEIILITKTKRKFLEKWRKYLITLILILSSDNYPYIRSYLNIKVGDKID